MTIDHHHSSCDYQSTENIEVKFYTLIILTPGLCVYGTSTSILAIFLLCRRSLRGPSSSFLCALSIYDIGVLIFAVWLYTMETFIDYIDDVRLYRRWIVYTPLLFFLSHCCKMGSVYTTVGATVERWVAVSRSKSCHKRFCSLNRVGLWIAIISVFSFLFSLPKYYELNVTFKAHCRGFAQYHLNQSGLAVNPIYKEVYSMWTSQIVMVVFPFFVLITFNAIIAYQVNHSTLKQSFGLTTQASSINMFTDAWRTHIVRSRMRAKKREATKVLFFIAILFLLCNTPDLVLACIEHLDKKYLERNRYFYDYGRDVTNLLATFNSAANSTIYIMFGKHLRRELFGLAQQHGTNRRVKRQQEIRMRNNRSVKRISQHTISIVPPSKLASMPRSERPATLKKKKQPPETGHHPLQQNHRTRCGSLFNPSPNRIRDIRKHRSPSCQPPTGAFGGPEQLAESFKESAVYDLKAMYEDLQMLSSHVERSPHLLRAQQSRGNGSSSASFSRKAPATTIHEEESCSRKTSGTSDRSSNPPDPETTCYDVPSPTLMTNFTLSVAESTGSIDETSMDSSLSNLVNAVNFDRELALLTADSRDGVHQQTQPQVSQSSACTVSTCLPTAGQSHEDASPTLLCPTDRTQTGPPREFNVVHLESSV